jgi:RNA polymerase sigma factor (sigma-70 family)
MTRNEKEMVLKALINAIQNSDSHETKEQAMDIILSMFEPFRKSLAKKFSGKGVDFDDICQVIDLKLIEAMYDYDENLDDSAIRHITSKARNGIFNFYKKEMNYFKEDRKTISIESLRIAYEGGSGNDMFYFDSYGVADESFDENKIIDRIMIEQGLDNLTVHQKELINMYYLSDMRQDEIAEELQIHQANVSRATKRGVKKLRESLNPLGVQSDKH